MVRRLRSKKLLLPGVVAACIALTAITTAQTGWSVEAQKARMKREDDAFYRHLPNDPAKRREEIAQYLSIPNQERILDGWRPSYEPTATPKAFKLKTSANLAGRWVRKQGSAGDAFVISGTGPRLEVKFSSYDAKGGISFDRHGAFRRGVLVLDRPVFYLVTQPFEKVYVMTVGKETRLLASADVALFERLVKNPRARARAIAGLTFRRS